MRKMTVLLKYDMSYDLVYGSFVVYGISLEYNKKCGVL